ncbi:diguanylate cyclase domain-containing protein [Rhodospira trueperi]|nr:diguanylate cyclase [Rhodospira trueperi]
MQARQVQISLLSQLAPLKTLDDPEGVRELLDSLQTSVPSFAWIGRLDADGTVVAATGGILEGVNIAHRPVFFGAQTGPYVGDVHEAVMLANLLPDPSGEPMKFVDVGIPVIPGGDGPPNGVLAAHLSWTWADEVLQTVLKTEGGSELDLFVVSGWGDTVLLGPKDAIGQVFALPGLQLARTYGTYGGIETWPDGKAYLTGYAVGYGHKDYPGLGWTVVARQPVATALAPVATVQWILLAWGAGVAAVFAVCGRWMALWITRPLSRIAAVADRLREGEAADIPCNSGVTEIDSLSTALDALIRSRTLMETVAHHDTLTGLTNRAGLDGHLSLMSARATREGAALGFLCLDLDGFKPVNDQFGHAAGDELLVEVAQRLRQVVRGGEVVARLGGDEFILVLHMETDQWRAHASIVADRVLAKFDQPFLVGETPCTVGCSIGIARWDPSSGGTTAQAMHEADQALYAAKRAGKHRACFFEQDVATIGGTPDESAT